MSNTILAIDAIMAALEIASRYSAAMQKAKAEGRSISDEEMSALTRSNKSKLAAFDKSIDGDP